MNLHSVFVRTGCILPGSLNPVRKQFVRNWMLVEEISALGFDSMIRKAGWHLLWLQEACSRRGFGLTEEVAVRRAFSSALRGISKRYNAAEVDSFEITHYPGFHVVNVTVQTLQVQQHASLKITGASFPEPLPAR
jgi:hypothetical protein